MKVLFLTHRLPYAPNRGDRNRAYHLLQAMSKFSTVSLFSLIHDEEEAAHTDRVPFAHDVTTVRVRRLRNLALGAFSLPSDRPLTHSLLDASGVHSSLERLVNGAKPDVVVAFCSGMARFALEPPLSQIPMVLDMVDVDSAKWEQLARRRHGLWRWLYRREARTLALFEARAARVAFANLVVNDRERTTLKRMASDARVTVMQNGIDLDSFRPTGPPTSDPVVVFCGVMNYFPNEEGVRWFAEDIWPRVRQARPDAKFLIVGSSPSRTIRSLAGNDPSIEVVGRVPHVQPYLHRAAVSVAPLRMARGIQTKVIEALAGGLPVVLTPAVLAGLPTEAEPGCLLAERPDEFARRILHLLSMSPEERRRTAAAADLNGLSWTEQTRPLEAILVNASVSSPRPDPG